MSVNPPNAPSTPAVALQSATVTLIEWLSEQLDAAWNRDNMPLARVIAGLLDDLDRVQVSDAVHE